MEYSGKIIKIIDNEAIVMTNDFEVVRIKLRKKANVGEKIHFYAKDIIVVGFNTPVNLSEFEVDSQANNDNEFRKSEKISYFEKKKPKRFISAAAVCASFVLIFLMMQFFTYFNKKEYTYIDVDINPSFSFTVDGKGMVDSVNLLNEDAAKFVEGMEFKKVSFADVLKLILNNYKEQLSYEEETVVLIAVAFSDERNYEVKEKKFLDELMNLNKAIGKKEMENVTVKAVIVDEKVRNEALEHNISMGKYVIYQKAKSGREISLDSVREKSVRELLEVVNIQDESGTYALIEFDMQEEEFALQDMPMEALESEQAQKELQETSKMPHAQHTPQETNKVLHSKEEAEKMSELASSQEAPEVTPKSGWQWRKGATTAKKSTQNSKIQSAAPKSSWLQKIPAAWKKSTQPSKAPTATPKSPQGEKTPAVAQKSTQGTKTPASWQKSAQPSKTPASWQKSIQPSKAPTSTPKSWQYQKKTTDSPKSTQLPETPVATPEQQIPEKTPKETPKLLQSQGVQKETPAVIPEVTETPEQTPTPKPIKNTIKVLEDWESGHENKWYGPNLGATTHWAASGKYSLRSRVNVWNKSKIIIFNICDLDFTGQNALCAVVKEEKSKLFEGKIMARLFIRTGNSWEWTTSEYKNISSSNKSVLRLDLSGIPDLDDVKSIGIEFYVSADEKGLVDLYTDYIYLE